MNSEKRRGIRTRGPRRARGGRGGARGGGGENNSTRDKNLWDTSIVVADKRKGSRSRIIKSINLLDIKQLPQGEPLERALTIKRPRRWSPPQSQSYRDTDAPSSPSVGSIIPMPKTSYALSSVRPVNNVRDISSLLHAGSEDDTDSEDEEITLPQCPVPRVAKLLMDTPEDPVTYCIEAAEGGQPHRHTSQDGLIDRQTFEDGLTFKDGQTFKDEQTFDDGQACKDEQTFKDGQFIIDDGQACKDEQAFKDGQFIIDDGQACKDEQTFKDGQFIIDDGQACKDEQAFKDGQFIIDDGQACKDEKTFKDGQFIIDDGQACKDEQAFKDGQFIIDDGQACKDELTFKDEQTFDDGQAYEDGKTFEDGQIFEDRQIFPRSMYEFDWRAFPDTPINPSLRRETFTENEICGPTVTAVDPYAIFINVWDIQFMEHIVLETNTYAQQCAENQLNGGTLTPSSRICDWKDTTVDELYKYFALTLAMGVVFKSRLEEYWESANDVFLTPGFHCHMTLRRYQLLTKCLHFANSCDMVGRNLSTSEAKLFKIKPVIDHLNGKFMSLYRLNQNISLDESLLQWKGWLSINQFIPNKAAHVGIKSYELCESKTGYLWRFEIHAHQKSAAPSSTEDPITAYTPALVLRLIKGLEYKGHTLWMDNFYNSPALARHLKSLGFDCVGTLRTNRRFVPVELSNLKKDCMKPGQIAGYTSGDVDLMVWRDQNRVATISTYHGNATSATKDGISKPILIRDYNICMGGVDKKDQMLAAYPVERKRTIVWYKKLFRRLLNVSVLNSYIIHKQQKTGRRFNHRRFRIELIRSLLQTHDSPITINIPTNIFLVKNHYPGENSFIRSQSERKRRACVVCHKRTTTHCVGCGNKAVCVIDCFRSLHS